jgi:hypothetical protein
VTGPIPGPVGTVTVGLRPLLQRGPPLGVCLTLGLLLDDGSSGVLGDRGALVSGDRLLLTRDGTIECLLAVAVAHTLTIPRKITAR